MSREESIEVIESLYGLNEDDIKSLLEVIGFRALSDEAVEMLAERQQARERRIVGGVRLRKHYPHPPFASNANR